MVMMVFLFGLVLFFAGIETKTKINKQKSTQAQDWPSIGQLAASGPGLLQSQVPTRRKSF
jgi:hypothetical protein